ncbi:MAG: hypothetical protein JWN71_1922 [Xanthobacteraceae bacterium]|jgi:hypothetical protein|nr:hypothetical protein [Xanthobacteraceae bacterium]
MTLAITLALWALVAALAFATALRGRELLTTGVRNGLGEFVRLVPRLLVGVVGSGFLADLLPQEAVARWIGPETGGFGIAIATLAGALTPGGPVIGFSIGATALKGGAGAPQVIAFGTAWALYALHRIFIYELPMMPARVVWLRATVSIPLPFLAAYAAMLIGKP